jgi:16S rRNA (guanine1207-N2)-methyltransferase
VQYSPLIPDALSLEQCDAGSLASAHMYAPAGTLERRYVLALALRALVAGAPLVALAANNKGGNRIAKELRAFGCAVTETSRAHHRMCQTTKPTQLHGVEEAIAEGGMHYHQGLGLFTQPGVFSWNRMDEGTALLLQHVPEYAGNGADLGCGLGVLSAAILRSAAVQHITLVDIDRRAVEASRRNLTDVRANFLWADITRDVLPVQNLDFVVMNPPFHDGGIENQTLGQTFIMRAAAMLKKGGACTLVANAHLPYEAVLRAHFSHAECKVEAAGFKVFMAVK